MQWRKVDKPDTFHEIYCTLLSISISFFYLIKVSPSVTCCRGVIDSIQSLEKMMIQTCTKSHHITFDDVIIKNYCEKKKKIEIWDYVRWDLFRTPSLSWSWSWTWWLVICLREGLLQIKMFSFGHCPKRWGGETPAQIF